jgi:hypothetical protein
MTTNKFLIVATILTSAAAAAAAQAVPLPAACGSDSVKYKVSTSKAAPDLTPPAGQALLVYIQKEDGDFVGSALSRLGIDGAWVGAVKGQSFLTVPVAPGNHSICASRQSSAAADKENLSTATLNAKAGEVYYFEFTLDRQEVGFAQRSNGGAGGFSGASGAGTTPDMSAKRKDTVDTVSFTELKSDAGPRHIQKLPISIVISPLSPKCPVPAAQAGK